MGAIASQITSLTINYSTVYSGAAQIKHQSSASLAFVRGIHRRPVNSPHKWPVTRTMFPFDDVIMRPEFVFNLGLGVPLWLRKAVANEKICYKCLVFFHGLRPCDASDRKQAKSLAWFRSLAAQGLSPWKALIHRYLPLSVTISNHLSPWYYVFNLQFAVALMVMCEGNLPDTCGFHSQRIINLMFNVLLARAVE